MNFRDKSNGQVSIEVLNIIIIIRIKGSKIGKLRNLCWHQGKVLFWQKISELENEQQKIVSPSS
jgi:hypothetical protein